MATTDDVLVIYKALFNYSPSDDEQQDGYISMTAEDILQVKSPFQSSNFTGTIEKPDGWLEGKNVRSGQNGYFPGNYVEYVKTEKVAPPPLPQVRPRPRVKSDTSTNKESKPDSNDSGYYSPMGKSHWFKVLLTHG